MGLVAKEPVGGEDFKPIPVGVQHAVCVAIWDLGTQVNPLFNKEKHKVMLMWEFPAHRITIEKEGEPTVEKPMVLSKEYNLSLHKKADLRKDLEGWREKQFTAEELKGFNLSVLLGVNCMMQIIHEVKGEGNDQRTYARLNSIMKLTKGIPPLDPEHAPILYEIDSGEPIPDATPDWIADKIRKSPEYQMQHPQSNRGYPGAQQPPPGYEQGDPGPAGYDPNDDIPF